MKPKKNLTQERLKELVIYSPLTGCIYDIVTNDVLGRVSKQDGYRRVYLDGNLYMSARLAWLFMEGYWPEYDVDHEDRVRDNDKWHNIRAVSRSCNIRNRGMLKNNTSGVTGVVKVGECWYPQLRVNDKHMIRGVGLESFDDAVMKRWEAEVKHGFKNCNSTSPAYLYLKYKCLI